MKQYKKLYTLFLKLDSLARSSQKIAIDIIKESEKLNLEKVFDDEWWTDGTYAYASNGELNLTFKQFVDSIEKTKKGERFIQ